MTGLIPAISILDGFTMQNMDFYDGGHIRNMPPQFEKAEPEFFSRSTRTMEKEVEQSRKKATRLLTIITALIIVSFTAGLVIGIKFAGGSDRKIVDDETFNAMNNFGAKVTKLVKDVNFSTKPANQIYPKGEYPFVIQLGSEYQDKEFKSVARFLSTRGHTVIVSKDKKNYRIFTGPYKTEAEAKKSLTEISLYKQYAISTNAQIIKRI